MDTHPYRNLRIPEGAPVELKPAPGKGWGMFAARDIEADCPIMVEWPLFVIPNVSQTRPLEGEIQEALDGLDEHGKEQFFSLRKNSFEPFPSLTAAFFFNKFTQHGTGRPDDEALLPVMARFNHSCRPNAILPASNRVPDIDPEASILLANKDIPAGTEITFPYTTAVDFLTRDERALALGLDCLCDACQETDPEMLHLSDSRRMLLRGLDAIVNMGISEGVEEVVDTDANPIILDASFRAAAERSDILHSTRFISYMMMPCVLEAEGLLGSLDTETYSVNLSIFAKWFKTPKNAQIADMAMKQNYWVNRLQVACHLWNRKDDGDTDNAVEFRERFGVELDGSGEIWHDDSVDTPIIEEVD
ncbi:SET domain protein [Apiospora saccharicola]